MTLYLSSTYFRLTTKLRSTVQGLNAQEIILKENYNTFIHTQHIAIVVLVILVWCCECSVQVPESLKHLSALNHC